jgi:hypothetical protein
MKIPNWSLGVGIGLALLYVALAYLAFTGSIPPPKPPTGIIM